MPPKTSRRARGPIPSAGAPAVAAAFASLMLVLPSSFTIGTVIPPDDMELGVRLSTGGAGVSGEPVLRADARRNRQRVLEAAEEVLSRAGVSARMEEIAQQAGVGVGTVYRNFQTKEALIAAIMRKRLRTL